ncbi:hypothetical protein FJ930_10080 [Mesorhizobium sp. B2-4-15]|uniref:hypothetical protein n=1 Tax=Mesorhizobium sp. B2-4-15 TaxID=2589934 RepID=UPI001150AAB1|nr:hypothetical protein [Mesorhizobium sp. B2-4-15]TPK73587.1 hypothetical protein FJ930_10080 [Mesorhizobium sp. B2-4-15]
MIAALAASSERTQTSWWILNSALSPERILPLVGLGVATALVGVRLRVLTLATFLLGEVVGALVYDRYLALMAGVPGATTHAFLTAPFSMLIIGIALIVSGRFRGWTIAVAAAPIGAFFAVVIKLTDPTVNDPRIPLFGTIIALWVIVAIGLTGRIFRPAWYAIGARILGSWLVAIGLLLGGAAIATKPPAAIPQTSEAPSNGSSPGKYRYEPPAPQFTRPRDPLKQDTHKSIP